MGLVDDLRLLPKAELHLHLDGSVRLETAVELAAETGRPLSLEEARRMMVAPDRCRDQGHLLEYFELPIALLQTAGALERVACELVEDLAADGVRYAEIRWAPRLHLDGGLSVRGVMEAVATGVARAATSGPPIPRVGLIVTAMRSHPPAANAELARMAASVGPPIVGFDLAGPELAWPAPPHAVAFAAARDAGLSLTAHAGEIPGAEHVRQVLDFGVTRVAHGASAIEDDSIVALLRGRDITLDMCPTSNVQANVVPSFAAHPLAALHRAGTSVTISTDDRTASGITLTDEMARCVTDMGLTEEELTEIALNAFRRGFAPARILDPLAAEAETAWRAWRDRRIS